MSQTIGPVTNQQGPVCLASGFGPVYGPGTQPFILDQLSAFPAAAFSVRQLTANPLYARQYCMLVRRSSDNATLNIGYVNGLLDTVSLLAFVGSGNGYVVTWYNQGSLGSSADATQSTAATQPQIVASGVVKTQNGVPSVYFGGSQCLVGTSSATPSGSAAGWISLVGSYTSNTTQVFVSNGTAVTNAGRLLVLNGGQLAFNVNTYQASGSSFSINTLYLQAGLAQSGIIYLFQNGGLAGSYSTSFSSSPTAFYIGSKTTSNNFTTGYLSETLSFFGYSAADKAIYDINTASYYGIAGVTQ